MLFVFRSVQLDGCPQLVTFCRQDSCLFVKAPEIGDNDEIVSEVAHHCLLRFANCSSVWKANQRKDVEIKIKIILGMKSVRHERPLLNFVSFFPTKTFITSS